MQITESIRERKSVRSYTGEPLRRELAEQIRKYIADLPQQFGGKARIELVSRHGGLEPVKLGTYGVVSGAIDYLVLIHDDAPLAGVNVGYMFEQTLLFCTGLGLGTCWIGGTFKAEDFASQVKIADSETLRIISPVGSPAEKMKLLDRIMKAGAGSAKRKPFAELFFADEIGNPLSQDNRYAQPLEMVRLAPSARNIQPWRVIVTGNSVHFYYIEKSRFNDIDMGIALCHFGETCREAGISGKFATVEEPARPAPDGMKYCMSWIG